MDTSKLKILNRDVIKYIAMLTMFLNHLAHMFLEHGTLLYEIFLNIGYFTAITMCYFLVEGYSYTRSKKRYGLTLLLFALLSQIPFNLAFQFGNLNMLFTLLACFLILLALERLHNPVLKVLVVTGLVLVTAISDWALFAPLFTIMFANCRNSKKRLAISYFAAYILFSLMNAGNYSYMYPDKNAVLHGLLSGVGILVSGVVILFFYNGRRAERGRTFSKWFFYLFYPAHLLILYMIKTYVI